MGQFRNAVEVIVSLFDKVPSDFPFDVDLSERPVTYELKQNLSDTIVITILSSVWIIAGPIFIYIMVTNFLFTGPEDAGVASATIFVLASLYLIWAVGFYFGPEINAQFRNVHVTVTDSQVLVTERSLLGKHFWSDDIGAFEGVAMLNLGTQMIDEEKIPLASLVLKHVDPSRSVPIAIKARKQLGAKTLARKSNQTGLPVLEGIAEKTGEAAYPEGTLVLNRYQSFKVRIIYWFILILAGICILGSIYKLVTSPIEPILFGLIAVAAIFAAAMHVYMALYVVAMWERGENVWVETAAIRGNQHNFPKQKLVRIGRVTGKLNTGMAGHRVNAPWLQLKTAGRFFPFIIDMQSDYVNEKRLYGLLPSHKNG